MNDCEYMKITYVNTRLRNDCKVIENKHLLKSKYIYCTLDKQTYFEIDTIICSLPGPVKIKLKIMYMSKFMVLSFWDK